GKKSPLTEIGTWCFSRLRISLREQGFSDDSTEVILSSWRISTPQRGQTIHLVEIQDISFGSNDIQIATNHLIKQSRPGYHLAPITFKQYDKDPKLCIVRTFREYLDRTAALRGKVKKMLVTTQKPHSAASRDTVSRWVKSLLTSAGVDKCFKPTVYALPLYQRLKRKPVHVVHDLLIQEAAKLLVKNIKFIHCTEGLQILIRKNNNKMVDTGEADYDTHHHQLLYYLPKCLLSTMAVKQIMTPITQAAVFLTKLSPKHNGSEADNDTHHHQLLYYLPKCLLSTMAVKQIMTSITPAAVLLMKMSA
ncbi:hypothetical protein MAR_020680, partial [Mya arenaria]